MITQTYLVSQRSFRLMVLSQWLETRVHLLRSQSYYNIMLQLDSSFQSFQMQMFQILSERMENSPELRE